MSQALPQSTLQTDPTAVAPGAYDLDSAHTRVVFGVSHLGLSTWNGDFSDVKGSLWIDPAAPQGAKLRVEIPVRTVSTTNPHVDEELRGPEWLDAEPFPNIVYESDCVVLQDERRGEVLGNLTLRGVTKAVALSVTFNGAASNPWTKKSMIGFDAVARIRRSDFGVTAFIPLIGDEVSLRISAEFSKV